MNKEIKLFYNRPGLLQQVIILGFFFLLEGCYCDKYCRSTQNPRSNFSLVGNKETVSSRDSALECIEYCRIINIDPRKWADPWPAEPRKSTSAETTGDQVSSVSSTDSIPQKNSPGHIAEPMPGEYFATTITAGPTLNFKSSGDSYEGGYGSHQPGVGFFVGVSTLLPVTSRWGLAASLKFTQKNASEKFGYSIPGGESMEFKDKYSYNYLGGALLAQYRVSRNLSVVAGPEVNYLLSASIKPSGGEGNGGEKQSLTKNSTKAGLDILAGIKYQIPAGNQRSRWGIQLMYDHRLSRLNKKKDEDGQDVSAYRMKSLQLGVAYNICGCNKK